MAAKHNWEVVRLRSQSSLACVYVYVCAVALKTVFPDELWHFLSLSVCV